MSHTIPSLFVEAVKELGILKVDFLGSRVNRISEFRGCRTTRCDLEFREATASFPLILANCILFLTLTTPEFLSLFLLMAFNGYLKIPELLSVERACELLLGLTL